MTDGTQTDDADRSTETENDSDLPEWAVVAAEELHPNRRRLLAVVGDAFDGRATTRDITDTTDMGSNLVGYHARILIDEGYLEKVGQAEGTGGRQGPNIYEVTESGEPVAEAAARRTTLGDVNLQLDRLQTEVETLRGRVNELEADYEELAADHEDLSDHYEQLIETLKANSDLLDG